MKLKDFQKKMEKSIFSSAEAHLVCFPEKPALINLQLHQWRKKDDLIQLKRGLYLFADQHPREEEIARSLYSPCYFSLEQVLSRCGILPEAVFSHTLLTPKATRRFVTPLGTFVYRSIKREAFTGFDSTSLLADKEKALVDYFYFNYHRFQMTDSFWESTRLEAGATEIDFKKVFCYAKLFNSKGLTESLKSFHQYAKSHQNHR